jgi:lysine biosynthesis protein LysW
MGTCPDCEENFELDDSADIGSIVECPSCKARLEILDLHPVVLDYAIEGEDIEEIPVDE